MWFALIWCACAHGLAAADDYRALDREARDVQRQFVSSGGVLPPTRVRALLEVDPSAPGNAEQALAGAASLPSSADARALWLARQWMHRGYLREAAALLARLNPADAAAAAERAVLQGEILARQGQPGSAAAALAGVQSPAPWAAYALYNRAVALVGANDRQSALTALDALGRVQTGEAETLALRDRANIASGFIYLGRGEQAAAKTAFDRVRLDSPFSSEALYGLGWVEFAQGSLSRALIPWTTLNERQVKEPAVREALLLLPYAQWRIGAYRDAVERYRAAIRFFDDEIALFDRVLAAWREGAALDAVQSVDGTDGVNEYRIAGTYDTSYVRMVLTDGGFQAAYDTWRHLQAIERLLAAQPAAALRQRAAQAVAMHRSYLQDQAVAMLGVQRERSAGYRARAHFELARLLDEMAVRGEAK